MALSICEECAGLWVHKKRGGGLANPRCYTCEPLTNEERKRRLAFAARANAAVDAGRDSVSPWDRPIARYRR